MVGTKSCKGFRRVTQKGIDPKPGRTVEEKEKSKHATLTKLAIEGLLLSSEKLARKIKMKKMSLLLLQERLKTKLAGDIKNNYFESHLQIFMKKSRVQSQFGKLKIKNQLVY